LTGGVPLSDLELFSEPELDSMLRILDRYMKPADRRSPAAGPNARPRSRLGKIIADVLFYALLLCLVGGAFLLAQGDKKPILGYSLMNVITGSMQSVYPVGSLVVVKETDSDTIQIGDDITFVKEDETAVTHRVIGITDDYEGTGERGFETQGVDNDAPDFDIVRAVNVVGVVKCHVPKVGQWLEWLRSNLVITLCFTAGILLLAILLKGAFKKIPENKNEAERNPRQPKVPMSAR
jgi:signal peptidase